MLFRILVQPIYNKTIMDTTVKRMNLLHQKRKARLDMRVPTELKDLVVEKAKEKDLDYTTYMMVAAIEKIEREELQAS